MQLNLQQFIKLLTSKKNQLKNGRISQQLPIDIINKQAFDKYSQQLKDIYSHIFNSNKNVIQLNKIIGFPIKKTKVPTCNKLVTQDQTFYFCFQCCLSDSTCMCIQCFDHGNHIGHRFKKVSFIGGNCDCGNIFSMKQQGFCTYHNGHFQIPEITQMELIKFHDIVGNLLKWLFLLQSHNIKFGEMFGIILLNYLNQLNKESLYYNVLTHNVLTRQFNNQNCFLDEIFRLKEESLIVKFKELFFHMFSIDEFKEILAERFITAYNTVLGFENTAFHSLFIQLLSNDSITLQLSQKYKKTLYIQKKIYNFAVYLTDLGVINSLKKDVAISFYQLYFSKNSCIPFEPLNEIQEKFEQKDEMHEVDVVTNFINEENSYYVLCENILNKIQNHQKILGMFAKGLFNVIMSKKYSFAKNKAVMPFHRVFALALFTIFKGNLQEMSIKKVSQKLEVSQSEIIHFYGFHLPRVLCCLLNFAETYFRRNYFYNYNSLYSRSGVLCINYDYLFIKQTAYLLIEEGKNFHLIIDEFFKQNFNKYEKNTNKQTLQEFLNKWMYFYQILIEVTVSYLTEIAMNTKLQLSNQRFSIMKKQIFKLILKKLGSVTIEDLQVIEKYFIHSVFNQNFLEENTEFNKITKKYSLKSGENEKVGKFRYEIYISKRKTSQMLLKEEQLQINETSKQQPINNQILTLLNTILPPTIIEQFYKFTLQQVPKLQNKKVRQSLIYKLIDIFYKLSIYDGNTKIYLKMKQQLLQKLKTQQKLDENQNNQQKNEARNKLLKSKMMEKKLKMMQKQNKIIQKLTLDNMLTKLSQTTQEVNCIICRDQEKHDDNLFYLSNVKFVKLLDLDQDKHLHSYQQQPPKQNNTKYGFIYNSCFHTAHYSCLKKMLNLSVYYICPLCKSLCNIMLPVSLQYMNQPLSESLERIQMLIQMIILKFIPNEKSWQKQVIFKSMVSSLIEQIAFIGLLNPQQFKRKLWRVCNGLLKLLSFIWNSLDSSTKQHLYQQIGKMIQNHDRKTEPKEEISPTTVIKDIKHYVISNLFTVIQGKPLPNIELSHSQKNRINISNGTQIRKNLMLVLENIQQAEPSTLEQQNIDNHVNSIEQLINYYKPPTTIQQLIQKRDLITNMSCKAGHNVCICIDCQQIVCIQCNTLQKHLKIHGMENMYFNLLTGGIIIIALKKMKGKSLYENNLGICWTPDKLPQGFLLNQEQYNKMVYALLCHQVIQYLHRKTMEQKQNYFIPMNNGWTEDL